jgi:hypothetical protein
MQSTLSPSNEAFELTCTLNTFNPPPPPQFGDKYATCSRVQKDGYEYRATAPKVMERKQFQMMRERVVLRNSMRLLHTGLERRGIVNALYFAWPQNILNGTMRSSDCSADSGIRWLAWYSVTRDGGENAVSSLSSLSPPCGGGLSSAVCAADRRTMHARHPKRSQPGPTFGKASWRLEL